MKFSALMTGVKVTIHNRTAGSLHRAAMRPSRWLAILVCVLILASTPWAYAAKTLYVENNGVDSNTCGSSVDPCRSISQAIANVASGDKIIVGPGTYGDLDGDGTLGEVGEETGAASCGCMLAINKAVTLISRDGAAATGPRSA